MSNVLDITFSGVGKPFAPCMKNYMGGFVQPFGWPASCSENIMFAQNALNTEQLPQKVLHHGRLCASVVEIWSCETQMHIDW